MKKIHYILIIALLSVTPLANAQNSSQTDSFETSQGNLEISFIGHATLMFSFNNLIVHVDPWGRVGDYSKFPKADIVLVTHYHEDHLDPKALNMVMTDNSTLIYTKQCEEKFPGGIVMRNGMSWNLKGIKIEAVPAYCLIERDVPYSQPHNRGECNGYIITFGDKRVYIASETENIPELKEINDIDISFIAMDAVYNLTPEEAIDGVKAYSPKVIYPFHYADADLTPFVDAFKNNPAIEVRIRDMRIK